MSKRAWLFLLLLLLLPRAAFPFDIWQHPEMAEKDAVFAGAFAASLDFSDFSYDRPDGIKFSLLNPEIFLDFMLPLALPFSLGVSVRPLSDGIFGIRARAGYHVNFGDPNLDAYALYNLYLEFVEDTSAYLEWSPAIGFRRRFGIFCISAETGFMAKSLLIGLSLKLN